MLPAVAGDSGDQPAAVQFPFNNTSGYAGVVYTVFDVAPGASGDGRVWSPPTGRNTISNSVPAFCVQQGALVRYDTNYVIPGSTTTVTLGAFGTPGATVNGSGTGLTVLPAQVAADGMVELSVKVADNAPFGTPITLTATDGTTTLTQSLVPADPYQVKDWSVSRASAPANMQIAAWIASHASTYSEAGLRGLTYGGDSDHVASAVMVNGNAGNESIEAAAAQLAIWQVLAGKNAQDSSSPISDYVANAGRPIAGQTRGSGGTFTAAPTQAELDSMVPDRAIELVNAATGDGIIGGGNDKTVGEAAHTPRITVTVGAVSNGVAQITVTGSRTSITGVAEPLASATVTLTGADFNSSTAGVQAGSVTLDSSGTATTSAVVTTADQPITARASVAVPAGALLAVASDNGPASTPTFALQQLITARASSTSVQASAVVLAAGGSAPTSTTTPSPTTTVPNELPFAGPAAPLAAIALLIALGGIGLLVRRRLVA